jgi:uncharacterized membrane protein
MKTIQSLLITGALTLPIMAIGIPEAKADLFVCNSSAYKAYVSKAWYSDRSWVSSGWTHVFPGECETILVGDMRNNSAYIYAADDNWNPWKMDGKQTELFCVRQEPFQILDADAICSSDMIQEIFYRVVSEESFDYTVNLE